MKLIINVRNRPNIQMKRHACYNGKLNAKIILRICTDQVQIPLLSNWFIQIYERVRKTRKVFIINY